MSRIKNMLDIATELSKESSGNYEAQKYLAKNWDKISESIKTKKKTTKKRKK